MHSKNIIDKIEYDEDSGCGYVLSTQDAVREHKVFLGSRWGGTFKFKCWGLGVSAESAGLLAPLRCPLLYHLYVYVDQLR